VRVARGRTIAFDREGIIREGASMMAEFTAATARLLARELYDYEFSEEAAASVAHIIGAMANYSRRLHGIGLTGLQPPFGYPTLRTEADRIRQKP
jgi:hypothetical protein